MAGASRLLAACVLFCVAAHYRAASFSLSRRKVLLRVGLAVPLAAPLVKERAAAMPLPAEAAEDTSKREQSREELADLLDKLNEAEEMQRAAAATRRAETTTTTYSKSGVTSRGTCWYELNGEWSRIEDCVNVDAINTRKKK